MKPETEQILGTLQVLTEPYFPCNLLCHQTEVSLAPFVWNVAEQGEFNILNLSFTNGVLRITDVDATVNNWQKMEYLQFFSDFSLEPAEISFKTANLSDLIRLLSTELHNCAAFSLPSGGYVHPPGIVVGQTRDNDWICVSPTVYKKTHIPNELISRYPLPAPIPLKPLGENTLDLQARIKLITSEMGSIHLEGGFDIDNYYYYDYQIVHSASDTKESAIEKALQASGMLEIYQFNGFYTNQHQPYLDKWLDSDEIEKFYPRYEQVNRFLKQNLSNLILYRCSFWNQEHLYVVGQSQSGDWIGLY